MRSFHCGSGTQSAIPASVARMTTPTGGSSRRARRLQKRAKSRGRCGGALTRWLVIRKPEMTKKTSTPTKPPGRASGEEVVDDHAEHRDGPQCLDVGPLLLGDVGGVAGHVGRVTGDRGHDVADDVQPLVEGDLRVRSGVGDRVAGEDLSHPRILRARPRPSELHCPKRHSRAGLTMRGEVASAGTVR